MKMTVPEHYLLSVNVHLVNYISECFVKLFWIIWIHVKLIKSVISNGTSNQTLNLVNCCNSALLVYMNIENDISCDFYLAELAQVIVLPTRNRFQATNVVWLNA